MDALNQKLCKLKPILYRGLSTDISGNIQFANNNTLIYPIGKVIVICKLSEETQQYIKLPRSDRKINIISISPNKKYLAVAEKLSNPRVSVFEISSRKRLKLLGNPLKNCTSDEFVCLNFTQDNKYLIGIIGEPDWLLLHYNWEKGRLESYTKAIYSNNRGTVQHICANPEDSTVIVLVGDGLYRQMNVTDTMWRQYGFQRAENIPLKTACWLNVDTVIAGSQDGRLILVKSGELRAVYKAYKIIQIEFEATNDSQKNSVTLASNTVTDEEKSGIFEVKCLTAFSQGFAYSCSPGIVTVFQKLNPFKYVRKNVISVMRSAVGDLKHVEINQINHIAVSPAENLIAATTHRTEIYTCKILTEQDLDKVPYVKFDIYSNGFHHGPIAAVSASVWKPLFITVGAIDKTARIWDYDTCKSVLIKDFPNEIYSASFHPSGLYCLMGFTDKLKLLLVLIDDLRAVREVDIKCCTLVSYSYGGNIFAAINRSNIEIYCAVYFIRLHLLENHQQPILSIVFTYDDLAMFVCDNSGFMYKWIIKDEKRIDGYTCSGSYTDLACTKDGLCCCTVSSDGTLKETIKGEVSRIVKLDENKALNTIEMSNSNEMLVVGNENGTLYTILYPLIHPPIYNQFHMHTVAVDKVIIAPGDRKLISTSKNGTLCLWNIISGENKNFRGHNAAVMTDILVSVNDYNEKIILINDLKTRLDEIETEHAYILQQISAGHQAALKEFHKGYLSTVEDLKFRIKQLEREHLVEINDFQSKLDETVNGHGDELEKQTKFYTAKLIDQYERFETLEQKNIEITEEYERLV
ncbi:hypothetical protein O3M35_003723 [Rhynocoris fuscipes]|uniref:WD repeat-containing protein 65 n=1 Tax=Rhynocoris fuscipes TaxID=488301 RepID=A0AAW1CH93_9HEMI